MGGTYTTARHQPTTRAARKTDDHAAITGKSDDTIKRQTGHDWRDWVRLLDKEGAATMTHGEIARIVHDKYGVADWWSQTVTVGYERLKGLRDRGQRRSGSYELSKSKTFNVPVTTLFDAWADNTKRRRWLGGVSTTIRTSAAPKSMRLQWPDGTIVAVWFSSKGAAKSTVALAHTKLTSKAAMERSREEWSARLDALAELFGSR